MNWLNIFVFIGALVLLIMNTIELKRGGSIETRSKALKISNIMLTIGLALCFLSQLQK